MGRKRRKTSFVMAPVVDRISNLPKDVTEAILLHLPLSDAVRTSILSRKWRYEWNSLPHLLFDDNCAPYLDINAHAMYDKKIVEIVKQVLFLHHGPIRKFKLAINLERCGDIDRWIHFVSRNGVKEFTLEAWKGDYYKVPSCLYLCEELTCLDLYRCRVTLPPSFKGFSNLTKLNLESIVFPNDELKILISICPLLKILVLLNIVCDHLNICDWKLEEVHIIAEFVDLCFKNSPLLANLSINLSRREDQVVSDGAVCKLTQLFGSLPRIERLELYGTTFPILLGGDVPLKLSTACQLKYLYIDLNFEDMQQILATLCIFGSSPVLQELHIKAWSNENTAAMSDEDMWEAQEDCTFSRVQIVKLTNFTGTKSELKLIGLLLANAPVLEKMQIELKPEVADELNILREMINFQKVSTKAKIEFPAAAAAL